nr:MULTISPECIES: VWA domain-containing protein [Streptomyces]
MAAEDKPEADVEPDPEPEAAAAETALDAPVETEENAEAEAGPETVVEPQAADTAEPVIEAEAEADLRPEAETEPETAERTEPTPEPASDVEPTTETSEAEAETSPEPVSEETHEATAALTTSTDEEPSHPTATDAPTEPASAEEPKATPDPEPTEAEPEATADTPVTEPTSPAPAEAPHPPQVADGEGAPQVAPALDDATRTGGAGGDDRTPHDPQAADGERAPQATPASETPRTGGAGGNEDSPQPAVGRGVPRTDGTRTPATPLPTLKESAPTLTTAYTAATAPLANTDLTGTRAKLYLVLDRSASMRPYYKDGSAQALADQTLALAAHLDPEATVHTVFFSTEVDGTTDLTLTPDHATRIDDTHADLGRMGRTSYHAAVEAVLAHYDANVAPGTPVLVVFQTDGAPDAKTPATQALTAAAKSHPTVFFSFVAFGDLDNKAFDYLRKLKTPNTAFFHAGPTPRELTDTELYEGVLATWRP